MMTTKWGWYACCPAVYDDVDGDAVVDGYGGDDVVIINPERMAQNVDDQTKTHTHTTGRKCRMQTRQADGSY